MAISSDHNEVILWNTEKNGGAGISTYNIDNSTWLASNDLPPTATRSAGSLKAVTDPKSGLVYIPNGADGWASMVVYNPVKRSSKSIDMPPETIKASRSHSYSVVWSTERNSILLYGGVTTATTIDQQPPFMEFDPVTSKWSRVETTGPSPGDIHSHCMVPAYNNTKMVVFGGQTNKDKDTLGSIYILDIKSMTWTKGVDVDPTQNRSNMACTVAGDSFVAWGGSDRNNMPNTINALIIYNLKANAWTDHFSVDSTLLPSPSISPSPLPSAVIDPATTPAGSTSSTSDVPRPTSNLPSTSAEPSSFNPIMFGCGTGAGVLAVVIGLFVFRWRRSRRQKQLSYADPRVYLEHMPERRRRSFQNDMPLLTAPSTSSAFSSPSQPAPLEPVFYTRSPSRFRSTPKVNEAMSTDDLLNLYEGIGGTTNDSQATYNINPKYQNYQYDPYQYPEQQNTQIDLIYSSSNSPAQQHLPNRQQNFTPSPVQQERRLARLHIEQQAQLQRLEQRLESSTSDRRLRRNHSARSYNTDTSFQ
ncbi:hypothetical protein BGZ51_001679 [Haplosporangium sp. Z 767]|nr:hypothetical protein BGZ51_001679 [Haplosporangium sp. Z 767]